MSSKILDKVAGLLPVGRINLITIKQNKDEDKRATNDLVKVTGIGVPIYIYTAEILAC